MNGPISRHGGPVLVTRPSPGSYVGGKWVDGPSPAQFTATMSIQPFSLREMLILPESERSRMYVKVYSDTPVRPLDEATATKGDRFPYDNRTMEVQKNGTWDIPKVTLQPHFKAIAAAIEVG